MTRRLDLFKVLRRRNEEYLEMPIYRFVTPHLLINLCLTPFSFSATKGDLVTEILSLVNTYPRGEICLNELQIELIFAAADILDVDFRDALRMELKDAKQDELIVELETHAPPSAVTQEFTKVFRDSFTDILAETGE